jgi:hypothetical protein
MKNFPFNSPYLTLPYLTLPYLTLPYLTLPYFTLPLLFYHLKISPNENYSKTIAKQHYAGY